MFTRRSSIVPALLLALAACAERSRAGEPADPDEGAGASAHAGTHGSSPSADAAGTAGNDPAASGSPATVGTAGAADTAGSGMLAGVAGMDAVAGSASAAIDGGVGTAGAASTADDGCLDDIADYAGAGPFGFEAMTVDRVKLWVPNVPAGCKVPITHFANGTGGTCEVYRTVHEHLASHGFLATCFESGQADAGQSCVTSIETALEHLPDLADMKVGSMGHHTGGATALVCMPLAAARWGEALRVVGLAAEPASGTGATPSWMTTYATITSPVFMFNGSEDNLVSESWVGESMAALDPDLEAYWYEGVGATHVPVPASHMQESAVAWFRWQLLGDRAACEHFKAMPDGDAWDLQLAQNPSDC